MKKLSIGLILLFGASACAERDQSNAATEANIVAAGEEAQTATPAPPPEGSVVAPEAGSAPCPIMRDFDWKAVIAAGKGGARELTVRGMIEVNKGGYAAVLSPGLLDKSIPPIQHLTLTVTPPNGPATGAITYLPVKITLPAQPRYRAIVIDCGGSEIEWIERIDGD